MKTSYWNSLWQRLTARDADDNAEVERITALQKAAVSRRAEYAELVGKASPPGPLSSSRKRMQEAEAAHTAALQKWENKQSGQRSR